MTKYSIRLVMTQALLILVFLASGCSRGCACSPADFLIDDFAKRCRTLAEEVRDTELAYRMALPDTASRSARLLDSWLAFFLDHGVTPPPVYLSLAGQGWEAGMRSLGRHIGEVGRGESVSAESLEAMTLPFELLAQPQQLFEFQHALASLSTRIEEHLASSTSGTTIPTPASLAADPEIAQPLAFVSQCCEHAPELRRRLGTLYESLTASTSVTIPDTASGSLSISGETLLSREDRFALFGLHLGSVRDELAFFAPIAFWQEPGAASQRIP
ncbi:MAG TPA: hypothetical protein PKM25_00380 [Candidatus Ozemobacteraceae bacterium]|nr:hypothetical protein [Candidatus Ozemobacteraceae bacterium]